jgi:hypothetical protein
MRPRIRWDNLTQVMAEPVYDIRYQDQKYVRFLISDIDASTGQPKYTWVDNVRFRNGVQIPWVACDFTEDEATKLLIDLTRSTQGFFIVAWTEFWHPSAHIKLAVLNVSDQYIDDGQPPSWFLGGCPFVDWVGTDLD